MKFATCAAFVALSAFAAMTATAQQDTMLRTAQSSGTIGTAAGDVAISTKNRVGRILGIMDAETKEPVDGVVVTDRIANKSTVTTESGLVGLGSFRSQHDSSVVTTHKDGYRDTTFLVMQNDTARITILLEKATVLSAMEVNADAPKAAVSDIESLASYTNASAFIAPGVLRSSKYAGKSLADAVRDYGMVGRFPSKYDKTVDDLHGTRMNPGTVMAGASPVDCTVKIVLDGSASAGDQVKMDDQAAMYDGALFYSKEHALPEQFKKFKGCDGTLILWTMGR